MWTFLGTVFVPLTKFIFQKIAKKKLNDKEFTEYILAHQKKKNRAGQTALDWEEALAEAQKELAESEKNTGV